MRLLDFYQTVVVAGLWFVILTVPTALVGLACAKWVKVSPSLKIAILRSLIAKSAFIDLPVAFLGADLLFGFPNIIGPLKSLPPLLLVALVHTALFVGLAGAARWMTAWRKCDDLVRSATPMGDQFICSLGVHMAAVSGLPGPVAWRNAVLVPAEGCSVLAVRHELSHNRHKDCGWHALGALASAALWWNPALLLLHSELQFWHEVRADEEALEGRSEDRRELAHQILKASSAAPRISLALSSHGRSLERRLRHLMSGAVPEKSALKAALLIVALIAASPAAYLRFLAPLHERPPASARMQTAESNAEPVAARMILGGSQTQGSEDPVQIAAIK